MNKQSEIVYVEGKKLVYHGTKMKQGKQYHVHWLDEDYCLVRKGKTIEFYLLEKPE